MPIGSQGWDVAPKINKQTCCHPTLLVCVCAFDTYNKDYLLTYNLRSVSRRRIINVFSYSYSYSLAEVFNIVCICRYEGTGRSLSLKLMRELEKCCTASSTTVMGSVSETKKTAKTGSVKPQQTSLTSSSYFADVIIDC